MVVSFAAGEKERESLTFVKGMLTRSRIHVIMDGTEVPKLLWASKENEFKVY